MREPTSIYELKGKEYASIIVHGAKFIKLYWVRYSEDLHLADEDLMDAAEHVHILLYDNVDEIGSRRIYIYEIDGVWGIKESQVDMGVEEDITVAGPFDSLAAAVAGVKVLI